MDLSGKGMVYIWDFAIVSFRGRLYFVVAWVLFKNIKMKDLGNVWKIGNLGNQELRFEGDVKIRFGLIVFLRKSKDTSLTLFKGDWKRFAFGI